MPAAPPPRAGLCERCRHQRVIRNTRGSSFSMCERSKEDTAYPKYPRLPVRECEGFEEPDDTANVPDTPP